MEDRSMKLTTTIRIAALLCAMLIANQSTAQTARPKDAKGRLAKAEAMFQERCKKSGEFIHRTAENVEGVFLMKIRPGEINYGHNEEQQFRMDDPYGSDLGGDAYIRSFLRGRNEKGFLDELKVGGYRYVEAIDSKDGKRYRYTGSIKVVGRKDPSAYNIQIELKRNPNYDLNNYAFVLNRAPAIGAPPRYGVTYDDISTRAEREYWIAGSSLKVIDLRTNEVMAERIGYMWDPGQGNHSGGRAPWLLAERNACPHRSSLHQTRNFVERILRPVLEK
jgi:hypothetical protein